MKLGLMTMIAGVLLLAGCQSALNKVGRNAKYNAYEMIGVQKRDLLKREVAATKDDQKEASEEFKDALEKLKAVYAFDGGDLEREYRRLNSSYEDAEAQANAVRLRIKKVETTAGDLFEEWKKEIDQIETANLQAQSRKTLATTQSRYADMLNSLKKAESTMNPVLTKLKDHVLYLKHNLNAKAIGSLKGEGAAIERDINKLINEMNNSIAAADKFIEQT
ncbi:MAG: DUF2959 domain-containing protein [Bdellovibrionaceae bacterium]|nr:DUF2959 domain-containing protein [Pseudobdellovibrionaceae bacterium]